MLATPEDLLAYDREHLWHPYASMTDPTPVRLVTGASGVRLTLADGTELVDGMSSWWAAIHGYNHPVLNAALTRQAGAFAHVMFGGLTHEPAVRLAERLVELAPPGLERVFLADSGSVSVEVALKMAIQHQRGLGR
ncbi:MAG: aminotransferase class III-fold pyridoxal phosphate-dependent enzyme, partial [Nocardioides sp.]